MICPTAKAKYFSDEDWTQTQEDWTRTSAHYLICPSGKDPARLPQLE
jgi:hypothetical protein